MEGCREESSRQRLVNSQEQLFEKMHIAKLTLDHGFSQLLLDLCKCSGRESVATLPDLYQTLYLWFVVRRSILDSIIDQRGQKFSNSVYA